MPIRKPTSMEECIYFTNREIGSGRATAWVFRKECQKCGNDFMGKPKKKDGKIDKKAGYYACSSCGYEGSNEQVESSLTINVEYKCPYCSNEGEATTEYKSKTFEGVPSYVFECGKCLKKIGLTKKMKENKKKENKLTIN